MSDSSFKYLFKMTRSYKLLFRQEYFEIEVGVSIIFLYNSYARIFRSILSANLPTSRRQILFTACI